MPRSLSGGKDFKPFGVARICGLVWRLVWVPKGWNGVVREESTTHTAAKMSKTDHGFCEDKKLKRKRIGVREGLSRADLLETLVHEALHAADSDKSEEWVEDAAASITRLLERFGRWVPNEGTPYKEGT